MRRRDLLKAIAGAATATFLGGVQIGEETHPRNRLRELADRAGAVGGDLYVRMGGGWERLKAGTANQVLMGDGKWADAEEPT